jgi:outer membrane receptor protein involved in Fe transport
VDIAAFYSSYSDLIDFAPGAARFQLSPTPHLLVPRIASNVGGGYVAGTELMVQWQATKFWRVAPSYTWLHAPFLGTGYEFDYARHRANVRSYVDLPFGVELNAFVSHVGALRARNVPAYTRVDTGLSWRATEAVRVGVWGRNLLDARHLEAREATAGLRYIRREAVAQVTWQFGRP